MYERHFISPKILFNLHVPDFDCDVDSGSDGSAASNQDIPSGASPSPSTAYKSIYF